MSDSPAVTHRSMELETLDGVRLAADVAVPDRVRAGAVVCHPHPQYGGNRLDRLVSALYDVLPTAGIATLRFDFRPVFAEGVGERLDTQAAIDTLAGAVGELPMALVGYSFGAWVALGVDDDRIAALVAIAPPLAVMSSTPAPTVPTLVLTPAHDQFSPPAATEAIIAEWRSHDAAHVEFEAIEMADHFLAGRTADVARRTTAWLSDRLRLPSPP
jgi:uncharacterized protein